MFELLDFSSKFVVIKRIKEFLIGDIFEVSWTVGYWIVIIILNVCIFYFKNVFYKYNYLYIFVFKDNIYNIILLVIVRL